MKLDLRQEQKLQLTQSQKLSLDVLTLTNQELETFLTEEYLENPLLECSEDKQGDLMSSLEGFYEKGETYQDQYMTWDGAGSDVSEDRERRSDVSDRNISYIDEKILSQLDADDYSEEAWDTIRFLVHCLDEKGFFPYEAKDIAEISGFSETLVEECLCDLRMLEPHGIFAFDIGECLIAQLKAKGNRDALLQEMIRTCMPELLSGKIANVTRKMKISTAKVREYMHLIGTLNPRPLMSMEETETTSYIIPDVLVKRENGAWQITINDRWMGDYGIDGYYLRMMKETKDAQLKEYFREKLQRAHFLIDAVERRRTIAKYRIQMGIPDSRQRALL